MSISIKGTSGFNEKINKIIEGHDINKEDSYDDMVHKQTKKIFGKLITSVVLTLTCPIFPIAWPIIAGMVYLFAKTKVDSALAHQRLWFIDGLSKKLREEESNFVPQMVLSDFISTCKKENKFKYQTIFKDTDKTFVIQLAEIYKSDRIYAKNPLAEIHKSKRIYDCDKGTLDYHDYKQEIDHLSKLDPEYSQYKIAKVYNMTPYSQYKIPRLYNMIPLDTPQNYSCPADDISHWKTLLKVQQKKQKALQAIKKLGNPIVNPGHPVPKLKKQYQRAQVQASLEQNYRHFGYRTAPLGYYTKDIKKRSSGSEQVPGYQVGFCHHIGGRSEMEDEHLATSFDLKIKDKIYPVSLFGVFDGHDGKSASIWLREHLEKDLCTALNKFCLNGLTDEGIWKALKSTFVKLNSSFKSQYEKGERTPGSTATMAMILDGKLWTANVGDSRTILDNGIQLSEDAKPNDPYYKKSINKRGGIVTLPRGGGSYRIMDKWGMPCLNVARAVGDSHVTGVCANPKITVYPLETIPKDRHLILACDGVYDVASTRQVARAVQEHKTLTAQEIAENIVYSAYESGSEDNLSALVVKL